jgi:hypothetical protein
MRDGDAADLIMPRTPPRGNPFEAESRAICCCRGELMSGEIDV